MVEDLPQLITKAKLQSAHPKVSKFLENVSVFVCIKSDNTYRLLLSVFKIVCSKIFSIIFVLILVRHRPKNCSRKGTEHKLRVFLLLEHLLSVKIVASYSIVLLIYIFSVFQLVALFCINKF